MSVSRIIIFTSVFTAILSLGHYYLWRRLVKDAELPPSWHRALTLVFVVLLATQPAVALLARRFPIDALRGWVFGGYVWMGLASVLFALALLAEVVLVVALVHRRARGGNQGPEDASRRRTLKRLLAGTIALVGAGLGIHGVRQAIASFQKKHVPIELAKLPPGLSGFRIAQLTDVHVGPTIGREFVERMVEETNALEPDLVAITGDLVDGTVERLGQHVAPLAKLRAKHGVFFVTGNHEYYSGVEPWIRELTRLGIRVLRNERVSIGDERGTFDLAGVTDHRAGRYGDAPDFAWALRNRDPSRELVLLAHQPAAVHEAQKHDVGLQLSGHTHGGQLLPWNFLVYLVHPVVKGLAKFGRTAIYVSTGTGYWGPPMRVGTESEITLVELRAPSGGADTSTSAAPPV